MRTSPASGWRRRYRTSNSIVGRFDRRLIRTGPGDLPSDEIALPCHPDATNEQIQQAVLAVMKAAHAIEFDLELEATAG